MRFGLTHENGTSSRINYRSKPKTVELHAPDPDFEDGEIASIRGTVLPLEHVVSWARKSARARSVGPDERAGNSTRSLPWLRPRQDRSVHLDQDQHGGEIENTLSISSQEGDDTIDFSRDGAPDSDYDPALSFATEDDEWEATVQTRARWRPPRSLNHRQRHKSPSESQRKSHTDSAFETDFASVQNMLSTMRLSRQKEEEELQRRFEKRMKGLWDDIETCIRKAEDDSKKAAAAEAERLRSMRLKQIEQEKLAEEARKKAQEKLEEEKRAKEKREATERAKAQEEQKKKAEAEREAKAAHELQERKGNLFKEAADEFERWSSSMKEIKENALRRVKLDPAWRKQCFEAKRKITPKVGQLTNSRQEIARITLAIEEVLAAARNTNITEIYTWILNHLSKCLIRQAEQEVAAKQSAAFPLAQVVSWLLLMGHVDLGRVLMSRLVKKCCWCLGYLPPRSKDLDDESYGKQLGKKTADETTSNFYNRICGIFAFYLAIIQVPASPPPSHSSSAPDLQLIPEQFRPVAAWKWQSRSLLPPFIDQSLTPSLWSTFLEVAGAPSQRWYGRQAGKIWSLLLEQGIKQKKAKWAASTDTESSSVGLMLLIEQWQKEGRWKEPEGSKMEP